MQSSFLVDNQRKAPPAVAVQSEARRSYRSSSGRDYDRQATSEGGLKVTDWGKGGQGGRGIW